VIFCSFPGQWPKEGPQPSKIAVLLFYLSVVFTIIGILIVLRSAFYVEVRIRLVLTLILVWY
jgi:heme/copper-type cytochrome/quinol oxidase subunit 4